MHRVSSGCVFCSGRGGAAHCSLEKQRLCLCSLETPLNTTRHLIFSSLLQGGVSGSIAKTATAPIERVKLLIQTQDANPKVREPFQSYAHTNTLTNPQKYGTHKMLCSLFFSLFLPSQRL